jgi:hypothetical protein
MTIDKFDPVWAESGDTTPDPSDEKIETGWVGGDKPRMERLNNLQKRVEDKINRIQQERADSFFEDATDAQAMLTTGLWDENWGTTGDEPNVIYEAATKAFVDMAVYFTSDKDPRLIVCDNTALKFEIWNPRTLVKLDTSDALTDDLPSGGGQTWVCYSLCTDGTNVYAVFEDTTNNTYQINAWDIATWDQDAGWAAVSTTGTALPGSGTPTFTYRGKVIIASPTKLATANAWNAITASSSAAVTILDITDGSIDASGAGDAPTGTSMEASTLCSDQTYIFFGGTTTGSACAYASCQIASPSTGSGGSNYPLTENPATVRMVSAGPKMNIAGFSSPQAGETYIRTLNAADADLDEVERGQNSDSTPLLDVQYIINYLDDVCFDGLNLWMLGQVTNNAGQEQKCLVKVDTGKLSLFTTNVRRSLNDLVNASFIVSPETNETAGSEGRCVFDGRDIWCIIEKRASQNNSGKIFRLPLALFRS